MLNRLAYPKRRRRFALPAHSKLRPQIFQGSNRVLPRHLLAPVHRSGANLVLLEPDVRKAFPDDESVNEALREIAKTAKQQSSRVTKAPVKNRRQTSRMRRAE